MTGIYIHIPFCKSKCPYCDFYSFIPNETIKDSYLKAVLSCLDGYKSKISQVDTVYFGGGTPSVFGGERLATVLDFIKENYNLVSPEITVECNPSSVDGDFFRSLYKAGVNRISMGMQSAVTEERKALGRLSDTRQVKSAIDLAHGAGIDNISLDIMLGVPGQTMDSLDESINFLLSAGISHISAYMLKIEEGTNFHKRRDSLILPDEDEVCDLYLHAAERFEAAGFPQYEISNFGRKGLESRHNLKYWHCEEYLGVGPSAHSYLDGKRFYYPRDFDAFLHGTDPIPDGEGGSQEEYIMLTLRLTEGLVFKNYEERYTEEIGPDIIKRAKKLADMGLVICDEKHISLTKEGFLLSNTIISELLWN